LYGTHEAPGMSVFARSMNEARTWATSVYRCYTSAIKESLAKSSAVLNFSKRGFVFTFVKGKGVTYAEKQ
jgi:hypothetical protein